MHLAYICSAVQCYVTREIERQFIDRVSAFQVQHGVHSSHSKTTVVLWTYCRSTPKHFMQDLRELAEPVPAGKFGYGPMTRIDTISTFHVSA